MMQDGYEAYYNEPSVVGHYKNPGGLYPVEAALLAMVKEELQDQPILDVGIGGGRTTRYLRQISKAYTGIDFSDGMIQAARQRFPGVDLFTCDARNLSRFQNGRFAAVFFLGAGIDDVNVADRLLVLKEINRVLRNHGIFILAAHNLEAPYLASGLAYRLRLCNNPRTLVTDNILRVRSWISHCSGRVWSVVGGKGYAIFMDYDERFAGSPEPGVILPTCYMRRVAQIQQLIESGFYEIETFDHTGYTIDEGTVARDLFLHYLARKQELQ